MQRTLIRIREYRCLIYALSFLIFGLFGGYASAGDLQITLTETASLPTNGTGKIQFTMENISQEDVYFFRGTTPLATADGMFPVSMFDITDSAGKPVAYIGKQVKMVLDSSAYTKLAPGHKYSVVVDLSKSYAMTGGYYTVSYKMANYYSATKTEEENAASPDSAELNIFVNSNLLNAKASLPIGTRLPQATLVCNASQKEVVTNALTSAKSLANNAYAYIGNNTVFTDPDDDGNYDGTFYPTARWAYWFGSLSPVGPKIAASPVGNEKAITFINSIWEGINYFPPSPVCDSCDGYEATSVAWAETITWFRAPTIHRQ